MPRPNLTTALIVATLTAIAGACTSAGTVEPGKGKTSGSQGGAGGEQGQGGDTGASGTGGSAAGTGGGNPGVGGGGPGPGGGGPGPGGSGGSGEGGSPGFGGGAGDPFGGASGTGGAAGQPAVKLLHLAPVDAVFSPPAGTPLSAKYKATLKESGKEDTDVTAETTFTLDPPSFGSFSGPALSVPAGQLGKAKINAEAKGLKAATSVTVEAGKVVVQPGAPADAEGKFGGPVDPSAKPTIVYPSSGILVPPNMNSLEIHFIPAPGQTLFELKFQSSTVSYTIYTPCTPLNGGCVFAPPASFWQQMANGARGNSPVSYSVRGVDGQGKVGASDARTMQFGADDMSGGIYYWNAAGFIMRYDFGLPTKPPELYMTAGEAQGFFCVGCHSISRNGQKIAVGVDIPGPAPYRVFNVGTKAPAYPAPAAGSNFFSFNPDASVLLISDGTKITAVDASSGNVFGDVVPGATMPDWSGDGKQLVYARPKTPPFIGVPGVDEASIEVSPFLGSSFGPPTVVVPFQGQNNYYPAFSPDNGWIVFNRSPGNKNSFANSSTEDGGVPDGELWAVQASGGQQLRLDKATQAGDSWPKWAPQLGSYENGKVMWLTFSSRRGYGLRLDDGKQVQLWMIAFDPARAAAGQDPSFPAFWLPFQDLNSGNHIAQWVTEVVRKPCSNQGDCPSGFACTNQKCLPL